MQELRTNVAAMFRKYNDVQVRPLGSLSLLLFSACSSFRCCFLCGLGCC